MTFGYWSQSLRNTSPIPNSGNVRRTASTCWPLFTTMPANVGRRASSRTTGANLMHSGRVPATISSDGRAPRTAPWPRRACALGRGGFADGTSNTWSPRKGSGCRLGRSRNERAESPRLRGATGPRTDVPTGRGTPAKPSECNNMLRSGQVRSRRARRGRGGPGWIRTSDQGIMSRAAPL